MEKGYESAYMFMKKHLKTNALFFIFYKESVSDFGNFGFKKPQTLAFTHICAILQEYWS